MTTPDDTMTIAEARATGRYDITQPDSSTVRRRQQREAGHAILVVSRRNRAYRQGDGRTYGEVDPAEQTQADAGAWFTNPSIRRDLLPMPVAVEGIVSRIWEVLDWERVPGTTKWAATFGRQLTDAELDREYPDFPYRHGDPCPTKNGRGHYPQYY